jgi:hypothetical protein
LFRQVSLTLWIRIPLRQGVLDTTLCDKVCQLLATVGGFLLALLFPPSKLILGKLSG